jgi:hypothetical protein
MHGGRVYIRLNDWDSILFKNKKILWWMIYYYFYIVYLFNVGYIFFKYSSHSWFVKWPYMGFSIFENSNYICS